MSAATARYIGGRLIRAALTIVGVTVLVFLLLRALPGDPVDTLLGDQASLQDKAALRSALGLDRPFHIQLVRFVGQVLDGSLGESFRQNVSVSVLIGDALPSTLALAFAAVAIAWLVALPLGVLAAGKRGSIIDRLASGVATTGIAIPVIAIAPVAILAFAVKLRWLPLPGDDGVGLSGLVLPASSIGIVMAAIVARQTRGSMIEVLSSQFIVAARARGLSERTILFKHALRNALLPVITVGAAQLGALFSGAVVVERIFERRGVGSLLVDAVFNRDFPVVQGCVLFFGVSYVLVNLLVDLLYPWVDPRVRLGQ